MRCPEALARKVQPNGDFGLLEWYPNIPTRNRANSRQEEEQEKPKTDLEQPYPNDFAPSEEEPIDEAKKQEETEMPAKPAGKRRKEKDAELEI
jgi:hypothetical protein